ncbi:MAG: hypothetical protein NT075_08200 [Chloroflexi bacterium]|nr:hypothetical protein [Chloroflexota bacterium]
MRLSTEHMHIIRELARGSRLQDHRNLEGDKVYKLHPLDTAPAEIIDAAVVGALKRQQLIASNMKFPAATYLLTDKGMELAMRLTGVQTRPLG